MNFQFSAAAAHRRRPTSAPEPAQPLVPANLPALRTLAQHLATISPTLLDDGHDGTAATDRRTRRRRSSVAFKNAWVARRTVVGPEAPVEARHGGLRAAAARATMRFRFAQHRMEHEDLDAAERTRWLAGR